MQTPPVAAAWWVGHRGWPARYPENTLRGVKAALEEGAVAVEVDIQFSADGEPVLMHDTTLDRVAGLSQRVDALTWDQLMPISVHEPARLGLSFAPELICHLRDLLVLMNAFPDRVLFLEVKPAVFEQHQRTSVLQRLAECLASPPCAFYLISYDFAILQSAKTAFGWPIGWVLRHFYDVDEASDLQSIVDVMICDLRKIPTSVTRLPQGPWDWFVYDVVERSDIERCLALEVKWLETWDIGKVRRYDGDVVSTNAP